jgi:hypothetical protein
MASARRVPLIPLVPKMLFPFLVILPGLLALALMNPVKRNPASTGQPNQSVQAVEIRPDKVGGIDLNKPRMRWVVELSLLCVYRSHLKDLRLRSSLVRSACSATKLKVTMMPVARPMI